jgi:hypothetical protein
MAEVLADDAAKPPFYIDLDMHHGTNDALPPRQINVQQEGTAYIWHSTTQELLPILPKDHPDYEENAEMVKAAIRRWNKGRS